MQSSMALLTTVVMMTMLMAVACSDELPPLPDYTGYKVYRLRPTEWRQSELLKKMEASDYFDFWMGVNPSGLPVDVLIAPADDEKFIKSMKKYKIATEVLIDDVPKQIARSAAGKGEQRGRMSWTSYHRLDDIHSWLDSLEPQNPDTVKVISLGSSTRGRDLKGVKISYGPNKPSVFIEGGIHAREWISPATATYVINELLTSDNQDVRRLARSFDWHIVPSVNPDGYEFTHNGYRLWRKSMSVNEPCLGVDLNRNFDFHWAERGASTNPCSETYAGPSAASEPETKSIVAYMEKIGDKTAAYISFHSYSQLLLIPYGNTSTHLGNYDDLKTIGDASIEALAARYGTKYEAGNPAELLYEVSGSSMDWSKSKLEIPIAYTYELRDTGEHGFLLPPEQIIPNGEEVMDSLVAMFNEAEELNYVKHT